MPYVMVNHPMAPLARLVAMARGVSMIHQTAHWQTQGGHYYADHLLFQRLYEQSQESIDQMAERAVGSGSPALVDARVQIALTKKIIDDFWPRDSAPSPQELVSISLLAEQAFLEELANVYNELSRSGNLSRGTSNLLEGVGDKHEEFVYLLRQRLGGR